MSMRAAAAAVALSIASGLAGQTPVPTPKPTPWAAVGPEFRVPVSSSGDQHSPSVAFGDDGSFVVAWTDAFQSGPQERIFARRFGAAGVPLSGDFQVNTYTTGSQYGPAIAASPGARFVVVWSQAPDSTGGADVFARLFDDSANPLGPEFMVNTHTTGRQYDPDVAMNYDGFVVVWTSRPAGLDPPQDGSGAGVFGQRFDAAGNPVGPEFQVNSYTTDDQSHPSVVTSQFLGDGVTVVWQSQGQDGSSGGIFGRSFGAAQPSDEFQINTFTAGDQREPDIAGGPGSGTGFAEIVTWTSAGQDGDGDGVFARLLGYGFDPAQVRGEFQVNSYRTGSQSRPTIAIDPLAWPTTGFVVAWQGDGQGDPDQGVFGQRFANAPFPTSAFYLSNPVRVGSEYQINHHTSSSQQRPSVAADLWGRFVVAWESADQDGSGNGVFARRFGFPDAKPVKVDQRPSGGTSNVNGVLEMDERVTVDPAWRVRGGALPLVGTGLNISGPSGPTYAIDDASADYGIVDGTSDCFTASADCYEISVFGTRPAPHWDATVDEALTSGLFGVGQPLTKTWALHVGGSFLDVPLDGFYPFIENIFHNGVTAGCGPAVYCGNDTVLRQQMAVFLIKSRNGAGFVPPPATGTVFDDVPSSSPFAPWIEELARQGISGGCAAPPPPALPSYCPTDAVNRQQTAVFLVKAKYGPTQAPPPCSGTVYQDVPCAGSSFDPFIELLTAENIAGGCQTSPPLFCPTDATLRKQMAALLVKTFGLELYGPD